MIKIAICLAVVFSFSFLLLARPSDVPVDYLIPTQSEEAGMKIYRDPGVIISEEAGSQFCVILESNPSTGYTWRINPSHDKEVLEFIGAGYDAPKEPMPGASGEEVFTFQVMKPGQTQISFSYIRPWEPESSGKTMTFTLISEESADTK